MERRTTVVQTAQVTAEFSGPLPLPQVLEAYERIVPGVGVKWVEWTNLAVEDIHAQRQIENRRVDSELKRNFWMRMYGTTAGLVIAMTALGVAAFAFYKGAPTGGLAAIIFGIAQLASVFIFGRAQDQVAPDRGVGADATSP